MKPLHAGLLLGLLLGALAALLGATPLFQGFEHGPYDLMARAFAEPEKGRDSRVQVLLLTDEDLERFAAEGESTLAYFPPPRDFWGTVIEELLVPRGVAVVALDVLLPGTARFVDPATGRTEDAALAEKLAAAGNVVLAYRAFPGREGGAPPPAPGEGAIPERARLQVYGEVARLPAADASQWPGPALVDAPARLGNAFVAPDEDGVIRRVPIAGLVRGMPSPSLALAAAMVLFRESSINLGGDARELRGFASIGVPLDGEGGLLLDFRGPRGTFRTASITQLTAAEPGPEAVAWLEALGEGDVVVVGANVSGNPDVVAAPTDDALPGPELIATAIDNLVRGDALAPAPPLLEALAPVALAVIVAVLTVLGYRRGSALFLALPVALAWLGAAALAFRAGLVLPVVTPVTGAGLAYLGSALFLYRTEGRKRREIRRTFSQYVAPEIVSELEAHPEQVRLGGEKRVMTVMFSDLAGFTGISERMAPEELVAFLNEYLTAMTDTLLEHGAVIDKYLGDAIMAFWGAPLARPDHARKALEAVAACQERLARFTVEKAALGLPALHARTGINTGSLVVGNMGSSRRFDYTVMGDSVNLASRIEGANKFFGSVVMLTQETLDAAGPDAARTRPLGKLRVKGRAEPVVVHELLGAGAFGMRERPPWLATFEEGLAAFQAGRFEPARAAFRRADGEREGGDAVARRFLELCQEAQARKGPFDGVVTLTEK